MALHLAVYRRGVVAVFFGELYLLRVSELYAALLRAVLASLEGADVVALPVEDIFNDGIKRAAHGVDDKQRENEAALHLTFRWAIIM